MNKKYILATACALLMGCSNEESSVLDAIPKTAGHYIVQHHEKGIPFITVAVVWKDGTVISDKGPLINRIGTHVADLERCGKFYFSSRTKHEIIGIFNKNKRTQDCQPLNNSGNDRIYKLIEL